MKDPLDQINTETQEISMWDPILTGVLLATATYISKDYYFYCHKIFGVNGNLATAMIWGTASTTMASHIIESNKKYAEETNSITKIALQHLEMSFLGIEVGSTLGCIANFLEN